MRSKILCLAVTSAALAFGGCAKDEPRELGREGDDIGTLEGDQAGGQVGGQTEQRAGASQGQLDGKTFVVVLEGPEGKEIQDELIFKNGMFDSTACREYGFSAVPYTATRTEEGLRFNAVATSGEATNRWSGVVKDDQIEGTVAMQQPGKEPHRGEFEGKLRQGQPSSPTSNQPGSGSSGMGQH